MKYIFFLSLGLMFWSINLLAQTNDPTPRRFTNGLFTPNSVSAPPISAMGGLWFQPTTLKLAIHNGSVYQNIASEAYVAEAIASLPGSPVTSVFGRSGTVVALSTDYSSFYTPLSHVGSSGSQHANATTSVSGFMSGADKTKLDGINLSNYLPLTGGTLTGTLTGTNINISGGIGSGGVTSTSYLFNSSTVTSRDFKYQTNGSDRWYLRVNAVAESGSNNGSNFEIRGRSDTGSDLGLWLGIIRSNGIITFGGTPTTSAGTYDFLTRNTSTGVMEKITSSSIATVSSLSSYELLSNKSTSTSLGASNTLYPTQNAVKTYVDGLSSAKANLAGGNAFTGFQSITQSADVYQFFAGELRMTNTGNNRTAVLSPSGGIQLNSSNVVGATGIYLTDNLTASRQYQSPDASGTIMILSDDPAPSTSTSPGKKGTVIISGGFRYECNADNSWVRSAVSTF